MDFGDKGRDEALNWITGNVPATQPPALFIQLHIGNPGTNGLANPAANTLRVLVTYDPATPGIGIAVNNNTVEWDPVPADETYSHVTVWDDLTAGGVIFQGPMIAPVPVITGSRFQFQVADATLQLT